MPVADGGRFSRDHRRRVAASAVICRCRRAADRRVERAVSSQPAPRGPRDLRDVLRLDNNGCAYLDAKPYTVSPLQAVGVVTLRTNHVCTAGGIPTRLRVPAV